jgi:hypothetical protein
VLLDDLLSVLPKLFSLYDRSAEVDEAIHETLANFFRTTATAASEEENELIDEVVGYEEQDWRRIRGTVLEPVEYFQVLTKGKLRLADMGKAITKMGKTTANVDTAAKSSTGANPDDSVEGAWGKATANIDISADRCLAYLWHHMSYEGIAGFEKKNGRLLRMQADVPGSHSMFSVTSAKSPFPGIDGRIYATKWAWRRDKKDLVAGFTFKGAPLPPRPSPTPPPLTHTPAHAQAPTSTLSGPSRRTSGLQGARWAPCRASGGSSPSPPTSAAQPSSSK